MERTPLHVLVYLREDAAPYQRAFANLGERFSYCSTPDEAAAHIGSAEVILGSISFPVSLLDDADRLRWIQVTGAGVDRFLRDTRMPSGVVLTRASDVGFGEQIAEYVMAHLLARAQRIQEVNRLQAARIWKTLEVEGVAGKVLGVAGVGEIGRLVGARAASFGMRVLGWARTTTACTGFERIYREEEWATFLRDLDVLVLTVPLTAATEGCVDRRALAMMKRSAILVNVARGGIVDEEALIEALRDGGIAGAILDVFHEEPLPTRSPLWRMPNVTITAHQAGLNCPERVAAFFLDNLRRFRDGRPLRGMVDSSRGY